MPRRDETYARGLALFERLNGGLSDSNICLQSSAKFGSTLPNAAYPSSYPYFAVTRPSQHLSGLSLLLQRWRFWRHSDLVSTARTTAGIACIVQMTRSTVFASSIKSIARVTNRPKKRHPHSIVNHGAERCGDGVPVEPIAPIPSAIPKFLLMFSGFRWTALEHPCPIRLNKPRGPGTSTRFEGGTVIDTARLCLMQSRECPSVRAISNLVIGDSSHIPVSERPV